MMQIPFNRTLRQAKNKGFVKTVSMMLLASMRRGRALSLKHLPERSIVKVNSSSMLLFPRQGAIHQDLFVYKKREPLCTSYLLESGIIKEGDAVLDIGANIGYYVLVESQLVGKSGVVYAVEPVLSNFKLLAKNVQLNNLSNVSIFQFAFGDKNGKSEIYLSDKANLCAVNKDAVGGDVLGVQEVDMLTVDEFVKDKRQPRLVRMDVEGYEYEIFKGMTQTLKGDVKILLELHPMPRYLNPKHLEELYKLLEENNFRVRFVVFEEKVKENTVLSVLSKKSGNKLPITATNITIQELKKLVDAYKELTSPNILFEKIKK